MQAWEEKILDRKEAWKKGLEEGIAKGKAEGISEGITRGKAEGISEGIIRGKAEGKAEGLYNAMKLAKALTDAGRSEDIEKASKDPAFCEKLMKELNI